MACYENGNHVLPLVSGNGNQEQYMPRDKYWIIGAMQIFQWSQQLKSDTKRLVWKKLQDLGINKLILLELDIHFQ